MFARLRPLALASLALLLLAAGPAAAQPLVSPDWLRARLGAAGLVVLDLRPEAAYAAGHVPGAVAADYEHAGWRTALPDGSGGALPPPERIAATIGALGVGDASHVVLVSDDFGAAARVFWTFRVLGHDAVSILDGGGRGWAADPADPLERGPGAPRPAAVFTPRYDPSLRAGPEEVAAAIASGGATLLDARPPAQWRGEAKSPAVARFGHLPGAVWLDQSEALDGQGRLKPATELARLFARVPQDRPVTAYCNTGHLAATDWFVLAELLGRRDARLYDGSLSQWAHDPSRPMVREEAPR